MLGLGLADLQFGHLVSLSQPFSSPSREKKKEIACALVNLAVPLRQSAVLILLVFIIASSFTKIGSFLWF